MAGIKRLPYRLDLIIWSSESCELRLVNSGDQSELDDAFPWDLPIDLAAFIHFHCTCAHCGARISSDLARCNCGNRDEPSAHLAVTFPTNFYDSVFRPILNRESSRIKSARRNQRKSENGGTYTKDEIATLFCLQQGICYFCGVRLLQADGNPEYHIDHYIPLSKGGENDIFNLVLTCCSCNLQKGAEVADSFERKIKKQRSPELGMQLGKIRRARNTYLSQLKNKGLSTKPGRKDFPN